VTKVKTPQGEGTLIRYDVSSGKVLVELDFRYAVEFDVEEVEIEGQD
jgi:hypothetical protein